MNKKIVGVIIIMVLAVGSYLGYVEVRRYRMLRSESPVLIINKKQKLFTFSDKMPRENITRDFKVVEYLEKLSSEEFQKYTEGLVFFGTISVSGMYDSLEIDLPQGETATTWEAGKASLSENQQRLCNDITRPDLQRDCWARHIIFNGLTNNSGIEICVQIYDENLANQCVKIIGSKDNSSLVDKDNNQLVDIYEVYAYPERLEASPLY